MTIGSGTVEKATSLLEFFSEQSPGSGLSQLARLSGINKATTLRYLLALQSAGFIEQDEQTSLYYLGPAFSKFARIREASNPFNRAVGRVLADLAALTNETSHVSTLSNQEIKTVSLVESTRSARVILPFGERLPLHATASGLSILAWAKPDLLEGVLASDLEVFTEFTIADKVSLRETVARARADGYARGYQGYELDVVGLAAPYFDASGHAKGAVAVAMPLSRNSAEIENTISEAVIAASQQITTAIGGVTPDCYPQT